MAYQAGEVATNQRSLAKKIDFQLTLTPSGVATFAAVGVVSDNLGSAGAVTSGLAGVLTDAVFAGISTNGAPAKIGVELKDGYARRVIACRAVVKSTSGAGNAAAGAMAFSLAADMQVTALGHVAALLTLGANTWAAAAGTIVIDVEFTYE